MHGSERTTQRHTRLRLSIPPVFRLRLTLAQLTCRPALAERDTAFAFALPESLPAFPPACLDIKITVNFSRFVNETPSERSGESAAHGIAWNARGWRPGASKTRGYSPLRDVGPHGSLNSRLTSGHGWRRLNAMSPPNTTGAAGASRGRVTWPSAGQWERAAVAPATIWRRTS